MLESMKHLGPVALIQTDGGSEFKKEFRQEVLKYARRHRYARPYKKNEQSYVERVNYTIRKECVGWMKYKTKDKGELQVKVRDWMRYYHYKRPHMGLGMKRPAEIESLSHLR